MSSRSGFIECPAGTIIYCRPQMNGAGFLASTTTLSAVDRPRKSSNSAVAFCVIESTVPFRPCTSGSVGAQIRGAGELQRVIHEHAGFTADRFHAQRVPGTGAHGDVARAELLDRAIRPPPQRDVAAGRQADKGMVACVLVAEQQAHPVAGSGKLVGRTRACTTWSSVRAPTVSRALPVVLDCRTSPRCAAASLGGGPSRERGRGIAEIVGVDGRERRGACDDVVEISSGAIGEDTGTSPWPS